MTNKHEQQRAISMQAFDVGYQGGMNHLVNETLEIYKGLGHASTTAAWDCLRRDACYAWDLDFLYPGTINFRYEPNLGNCINFKLIEADVMLRGGPVATFLCHLRTVNEMVLGVAFVIGNGIEVSCVERLENVEPGKTVDFQATFIYDYGWTQP